MTIRDDVWREGRHGRTCIDDTTVVDDENRNKPLLSVDRGLHTPGIRRPQQVTRASAALCTAERMGREAVLRLHLPVSSASSRTKKYLTASRVAHGVTRICKA